MNIFKKTMLAATAAVVLGLGSTGSAFALTVLDFQNGYASGLGTVMDIGGGHYEGIDIGINLLVAFDTPTGGPTSYYNVDGLINCPAPCDGVLGGTAGELNFNTSDKTFSIAGTIPSLGIDTQTTLLFGTITKVNVTEGSYTLIQFFGHDQKSIELLNALGINPNTPFGFGGVSINITSTGIPVSVDILNTAVPEPTSLLLLGSGLVGVFCYRIRKQASINY